MGHLPTWSKPKGHSGMAVKCTPLCTPGTGVNLWGASPLCVNPVNVFKSLAQTLAEGKGGTVRDRLEEASGKAMSRRTETAYKAQSPGKSAQHDEAPDSGDRVNAAVV